MNLTTNRFPWVTLQPATPSRPRRSTFLTRHNTALAFTIGIGAWLAVAVPCRADGLVISAPDITASAGSSGSFLVLITDPSNSATSYNVAGDSFELTLTGTAGISFTNVTTDTSASPYNTPYIYANSVANDYDLPLYTTLTPTNLTASDAFDVSYSPGYTTLMPGGTYALGLVSYTVSPTAMAGSSDTIAFGAMPYTSLSDNNSNSLGFATTNGSITIASVSEPSTSALGMIAIAIAGLTVFWSRRRGRDRPERLLRQAPHLRAPQLRLRPDPHDSRQLSASLPAACCPKTRPKRPRNTSTRPTRPRRSPRGTFGSPSSDVFARFSRTFGTHPSSSPDGPPCAALALVRAVRDAP
jgi:hypothetical protein